MEQSTKLFLALGFLFIVYATMKGHLKSYIALLWGSNASVSTAPNPFSIPDAIQQIATGTNPFQYAATAQQGISMVNMGLNTLGINVGQK